jgi:serine protease AprX
MESQTPTDPAPSPEERRKQIKQDVAPRLIAEPLRTTLLNDTADCLRHLIIELNTEYPGGLLGARSAVIAELMDILTDQTANALRRNLEGVLHPYLFAELRKSELFQLLERDGQRAGQLANYLNQDNTGAPVPHRKLRAIFKVWESTEMRPLTTVSVRTVKADAAQTAYSASGANIVWAVLDSGIQGDHPHFERYQNLNLSPPLIHRSFLPDSDPTSMDPLLDPYGHGTHVAGIIAGYESPIRAAVAAQASVSETAGSPAYHLNPVAGIRGMAPQCGLLSLKILDANGAGDVTAAINALEYVLQLNAYGQHNVVHGVNLSAGYHPDARWYGTGQTPLCRQVDRVVRNGVCVVVAAGNTGYVLSAVLGADGGVTPFEAGQLASINDPGNAKFALTVGATHREEPHTFGVSYFSSKGPTADGRIKPDVIAPGEKIISCAAGVAKQTIAGAIDAGSGEFQYLEDTGTSMAAPHVSGIIASFLSIRPEFKGQALEVHELVRKSALDLKRDNNSQGAGLVDLMRMIESV